MKVSTMATEPVSSALGAGLIAKLGLAGAIGALGGAIMAVFDPPASRRELFLQAACAGSGSLVFGSAVHSASVYFLSKWVPAADLLLPAYFVTGALSWGVFGALAKLRKLVADKAASKVASKVGLDV